MKKYLFETEETLKKRKFIKLSKTILLSILFFISFPLLHYSYINKLITTSKNKFFEKEPDSIVVFTGDKGRVKKALNLSKQYPSSKVLISGVYYKNNLKNILNKTEENSASNINHFSRIVELDFEAMNTYQNVFETLQFLEKNKELKNILIISSDYHLPRIDMMISSLNENDKLKFYFEEINSDSKIDFLVNIFKEHIKILKYIIGFN